jgi:hypothetical protein
VDRAGRRETVKVIREEHEWRGLSIVCGRIPREIEAEGVMTDGGYELINDVLFYRDREHDSDSKLRTGSCGAVLHN